MKYTELKIKTIRSIIINQADFNDATGLESRDISRKDASELIAESLGISKFDIESLSYERGNWYVTYVISLRNKNEFS